MVLTRLLLLATLLIRHPIHSSSAEVNLPTGRGKLSVILRVFADDFPPGQTPVGVLRYLAQRFRIQDAGGRALALRLDSIRVEGVVLVLGLSAPTTDALVGGRIWHGVLGERFTDQVNLVRVHRGVRSSSLLFTATDGSKALP